MKKAFESGKIWTFLSAFIFMMTCGLVAFAITGLPSSNPGLWFTDYQTDALKGKHQGLEMLAADDWNAIMSGLNEMIIPKGAIMAFTDTCPKGWTHYAVADGRFLMGTNDVNSLGTSGGVSDNRITLHRDNLPMHQHYIRFGMQGKYGDDDHDRAVVVDWNTSKFPRGGDMSNYTNDCTAAGCMKQTNPSWVNLKKESMRYGVKTSDEIAGTTNSTNGLFPVAIDITNKHIKVNYCIKD